MSFECNSDIKNYSMTISMKSRKIGKYDNDNLFIRFTVNRGLSE